MSAVEFRCGVSTAARAHSARVLVVLCAVVVALAAAAGSAAAHAAFQDASPEPGARLPVAPTQVRLVFTESLNRQLTSARIIDARTNRSVPVHVRVQGGRRLIVLPVQRLATGAYLVKWHTVSILDGHALEGSFGFGVRTRAVHGAQRLEQSPLARSGWLRVALRTVWYAALFYFGAGVLLGCAFRSRYGPARWLLGESSPASNDPSGTAGVRRAWGRTRVVGWVAVAAGAGVALAETQDAAGSLTWRGIRAYLFSTTSGEARVAAVLAVLIAALLAGRALRVAAVALLAGLYAVAVGGHANSASPHALALGSDWVHLVAAIAWVGGIAQIAAMWVPGIRDVSPGERRRVMREVLDRFGRVALPAVAVLAVAGGTNALIELGRVSELWTSAYGRVLLVKIALFGVIVAASYTHAFRLRRRIMAAAVGDSAAERHHWRLIGSQPAFAALVLGAAALLAVFPLPPRQLLERAEAGGRSGAGPPRQPPATAGLRAPRPGELASAEQAGPWIAAAWVTPSRGALTGTVRLMNFSIQPVRAHIQVAGAAVRTCGLGCVRFRLAGTPASLRVTARRGRSAHTAVIPVQFRPGGADVARRILNDAIARIDELRAFRIAERLSGGLGGPAAISRYRIATRHDYAITARNAGPSQTVVIGSRVWVRQPDGSWQVQSIPTEDTRELMAWWTHRAGVRLLDVRHVHGRPVADLALADLARTGTIGAPFWFRLRVDLQSRHVLMMRMIAPGHFMNQRYYAFGIPVHVVPPVRSR
ncbi:copper resistance protein CopC/CopD [Paraconexibacter antarcticus]|uniref:Copper resistance protein CopC/CopD n=1 Tax=Paraconexibacter antarcticus TaxID=2949664 RepID=A0ABY5DRA9_9ACTN|nr:CopD family protein [Paraconexibacter antarcticus]UTI64000.1 copper resistance protein CopC/CopD [Paraconexibacter antarcticus]